MRIGIYKSMVASAVLALGVAAPVAAVPVQWTVGSGGNGHFYEFISIDETWTAARTAAQASSHLGQQGYLATITSAAEQTFVLGLANDGWLGGTDQTVEGEWRWADGPEAGNLFWTGGPGGTPSGFASWNGGEPNNSGDEDFLDLQGGAWNDLPTSSTRGRFVEFNAAVPLPGTLSLAGLALAALLVSRRRTV